MPAATTQFTAAAIRCSRLRCKQSFVSSIKKGGLPNITGNGAAWNVGDTFWWGAFYTSPSLFGRANSGAWQGSYAAFSFNAARSNPIYGAASTVVPAHVNTLWCIRY